MEELRIPYGVSDTGAIISAADAKDGTAYFCPNCSTKLILKVGNLRIKHFSHPATSNCNRETVLHKSAKLLIIGVIKGNANSGVSINLIDNCKQCRSEYPVILQPGTFSGAKEEVKVTDYVCDVVGYRGEEIALAIEILVTHDIDAVKAKSLPTYWIELAAEDVVSAPTQWKPTQKHLKPTFCPRCKISHQHVHKIADRWRIDRGLYSPVKDPNAATYIAEMETCFKCGQEIPVFWWRGVPFCEKEPPLPRPRTIKYIFSKTYGGSYWANTCASCGSLQGDNFLYILGNAPLRGLCDSTDSTEPLVSFSAINSKVDVKSFLNIILPRQF